MLRGHRDERRDRQERLLRQGRGSVIALSRRHSQELNWAELRSVEANNLLEAAKGESGRDDLLAKQHLLSALVIMNDVMNRFPTAERKMFRHALHMGVFAIIKADAKQN